MCAARVCDGVTLQATCVTPVLPPETGAVWPTVANTPSRPCTYVYDNALVSSVTSVTPTTAHTGSLLVITGTNFVQAPFVRLRSTVNAAVEIDCWTVSWSATSIQCGLADGPSGVYTLRVIFGECDAA